MPPLAAWGTVIIGTWIVYPWYRDPAPDSPRSVLLADDATKDRHEFGMAGWVYVAFIIDVFSRFVIGWQASRSLRSDLTIDALDMAVWNRQRAGADLDGLVHHSDSEYVQAGSRAA